MSPIGGKADELRYDLVWRKCDEVRHNDFKIFDTLS